VNTYVIMLWRRRLDHDVAHAQCGSSGPAIRRSRACRWDRCDPTSLLHSTFGSISIDVRVPVNAST